MKACNSCNNWCDATSECAKMLNLQAKDFDFPAGMDEAIAGNPSSENNCEGFIDG